MQHGRSRAGKLDPVLIPRHCEAYPSFSMAGVAKQLREEKPFCEWYDDQGGLAAQMDAEMLGQDQLYILFSCGAATYRHQRGAKLRVHLHRQLSGRTEPRVHCPVCHKLSVRLFHKTGRWACQFCQQLVERRTLLTEREKLVVRREVLVEQVHARPKPSRGYHIWERARRELIAIEEVFATACKGEALPRLAYPLRHQLRTHWFGRDDERTEREPHDEAAAYLET